MKKYNKLLSAIISLGLVASNLVFSVSASDNMDVSENFINVYDEEIGIFYQIPDESDEQMQLAANLIPLSQPTGLIWHYDDNRNQNLLGAMAWNAVNNCEGDYKITLYRNDQAIKWTNWSGLYDHDGDGIVGCEFVHDDAFTESGAYRFEVIAKGDGRNFSDSVAATSSVYNFTAPSSKLLTPSNVRWTGDGAIEFDGVPNASAYEYTLYDQNGQIVGSTWDWVSHEVDGRTHITDDLSWYLRDIASRQDNEGITGIAVSVKALTSNIEVYKNSDESALSGLYDIASLGVSVNGSLGNILNDVYDGNLSAVEALDEFLGSMNDNDISNADIALSMIDNPEVVDNIRQLEEAYMDEVGITSTVSDASSDSGYLESRGIDVNKVEVVGAALNSFGRDVDINFSEADPGLSVDQLYYKNSVAVNIGIDGVNDSQNLDVPIQITMPVPTGVRPERLVILHYHADGSVEEIHPAVSTSASGEVLVTFVLTSFSPFVFCNLADEGGDNEDEDDDVIAEGSISVSTSSDAPIGGTFNVDVDITDNPGIAAVRLGVEYDSNAFEFDSITYGDIFDENAFTEGNPDCNPYIILACVADANVSVTGKLATLTFNVKPEATLGGYEINIVNLEACDIYESDVSFDITNGFVTVSEPDYPTVNVTPVVSSDGEKVYAYLNFINNPGVAMLGFDIEYDSNIMTLTNATNGSVFPARDITYGNISMNPYSFLAYDTSNNVMGDGPFFILEFDLIGDATAADITTSSITIGPIESYDIDENVVEFSKTNSPICKFGDVNRDGDVNRLDLLRLAKYFAGYEVDIFVPAADVIINSVADRADLLRLAKVLSGWDEILGE